MKSVKGGACYKYPGGADVRLGVLFGANLNGPGTCWSKVYLMKFESS